MVCSLQSMGWQCHISLIYTFSDLNLGITASYITYVTHRPRTTSGFCEHIITMPCQRTCIKNMIRRTTPDRFFKCHLQAHVICSSRGNFISIYVVVCRIKRTVWQCQVLDRRAKDSTPHSRGSSTECKTFYIIPIRISNKKDMRHTRIPVNPNPPVFKRPAPDKFYLTSSGVYISKKFVEVQYEVHTKQRII